MSTKNGRKQVTGSTNDLRFSDETCFGNMSNLSNVLDGCLNSTSYSQATTASVKRPIQPAFDVIQVLKTTYGITLPKNCEELLGRLTPTFDDDLLIDPALKKFHHVEPPDSCGSSLNLDSDLVKQMHHLTMFRREFVLSDDLTDLSKHQPQWTEAELDTCSHLMGNIQKQSAHVLETLKTLGEFAASLDLIRTVDV